MRQHGNGNRRRRRKRSGLGCLLRTFFLLVLIGVCIALGMALRAHRFSAYDDPDAVPYRTLAERYAKTFDVDPNLVKAVIRQESNFNPKAHSHADAKGLMQLTDASGELAARNLKEKFDVASLYDPETNVRYGVWMLHYLLRRFDGVTETALAAYNGGMGNVSAWLQDPTYSTDGRTLQKIPFSETQHYVRKVMQYYEHYKTFP